MKYSYQLPLPDDRSGSFAAITSIATLILSAIALASVSRFGYLMIVVSVLLQFVTAVIAIVSLVWKEPLCLIAAGVLVLEIGLACVTFS